MFRYINTKTQAKEQTTDRKENKEDLMNDVLFESSAPTATTTVTTVTKWSSKALLELMNQIATEIKAEKNDLGNKELEQFIRQPVKFCCSINFDDIDH